MLTTPEGIKPLFLRCVCSSISILAHAQQFLTEFSTRQKTGITHVTTCYREKSLCSNMFCCVLPGRDH